MLKLRPLAERFISWEVGNGLKISFWYDTWTPLGPLIKFLGEHATRRLRLPLNASVPDACSKNAWLLPSPRSDNEVLLHAHLTLITLPTQNASADMVYWLTNGLRDTVFSTAKTWNECRPMESKKEWSKLVWFKGCVPKHAFHMWTAQLNRLPTRLRLASWNMAIPTACPLCLFGHESRDHILLHCGFSAEIWRLVLSRFFSSQTGFLNWTELLSWIKQSSSRAPALMRKIAAQTTIYHIWRQRNHTLHNHIVIPATSVFKSLDREIMNIILGRRHKKEFSALLSLWLRLS